MIEGQAGDGFADVDSLSCQSAAGELWPPAQPIDFAPPGASCRTAVLRAVTRAPGHGPTKVVRSRERSCSGGPTVAHVRGRAKGSGWRRVDIARRRPDAGPDRRPEPRCPRPAVSPIDPVLFSFHVLGLEFAIRWYALGDIAGLLLGWRYVVGFCRRPGLWGGTAPMRPEQADDLLSWMILGVILGGRLGYVLFYQPGYFAANPAEILAVWHGGMSFHGGLLGVAAGVIGFSLRNGLRILSVGDAVSAAAPIGLFFGRIANFINGELWGRPSTAPWAVVFPAKRPRAARSTGWDRARGIPLSSTRRGSRGWCSSSCWRWRSGPAR